MRIGTVFLTIILFSEGMVTGQEKVFTLPQLIDSALSRPVVLRIDSFPVSHKQSWQFWRPVEISYRKGYLYSSEVEQEWRIRQELESPVRWIDGERLEKEAVQWIAADSVLQVKQFVAALKKTYFLCVFRYAQYSHYRRVLDMVDRWLNQIPMDSLDGETERLYAEWWLKLQDSYFDWLEAQNDLRYRAGLTVSPIPADTIPELYQIEPIPDTLTRTPARLFFNVYDAQMKYETRYWQWMKHGRWPSLFFDVSLRSNPSHHDLMAWQVGVRIPLALWISPEKSDNAYLRLRKTELGWQKKKESIEYQSERLIILMNKHFARINHFRNRVLPQMERETYRIVSQVLDEKAMLTDGVARFLSWQSYYSDYLKAIYEYNCLAAELELLAY